MPRRLAGIPSSRSDRVRVQTGTDRHRAAVSWWMRAGVRSRIPARVSDRAVWPPPHDTRLKGAPGNSPLLRARAARRRLFAADPRRCDCSLQSRQVLPGRKVVFRPWPRPFRQTRTGRQPQERHTMISTREYARKGWLVWGVLQQLKRSSFQG